MDIEENQDNGEPSDVITSNQNNSMDSPSAFMTSCIEKLIEIKSMVSDKKVRNTISKLTSGKPITEEENVRGIVDHQLNYRKKQPTYPNNSGTKDMIKINTGKQLVKGKSKIKQHNPCKKSSSAENKLSKSACEIRQCNSPKPVPSHYYVDSSIDDSASDSDIPDEEKCCICKMYTPKEIRESNTIKFTKWVQCDNMACRHWVHLKFCTSLSVIRKGVQFYCPHCEQNTEE